MRAIQIDEFGDPAQVLRVVDIEEPPPPGPHEVLLSVEYSPLNKHDLLVVLGALGQPALPHIPGAEGVARVLATGAEVDGLQIGDLVVLPLYAGAWRERLVVPADSLFALPSGDIEQYSMLGSNPPTAGLLLSEFASLKPGDWVVQNAANSGVGRSLIALAKHRGLKTINLARDEKTLAELASAGADVVHVDNADAATDVRALIGDERVGLAVDSVGGPTVAHLVELLSDGGSLVSYSWASDQPMWIGTPALVAKHLTVYGFFVGDFDYRNKVVPVIREAAPLVADGTLAVPVAGVYPLEDIHDAMAHQLRGGKILLQLAGR